MQTAIEFLLVKRGSNVKYSKIAQAVGVSVRTLGRWRKLPEFQAEQRRRSIEIMGDSLPLVLDTLTKKAIAGNNKSIELYLKTLGLIREGFDIMARSKAEDDDPRSNANIEAEIEELRRQLGLTDDDDKFSMDN
ncbi:hypothetical protein L9W92_18225 [Pelotomaculum terephthalicicum JT]|uniref:phBC6A51 family helix-turn-helix protein n=1 Tax=Pelotomaculum TaxID=191373 RepID=UPI0009C872F0|nr:MULTISPECIES: phBC6A51 family helix-turn-helix protein [Pelotomaculum]MCG9969935.1 hypothetical protein [Pelotomaculum terephthalicicum JT]OPX92315.1 MAG: hypothetical protein A4E54_00034 [Pelotomaculum sp. PtaB.Bin117]OPY60193.1 MAG: hypothetical protein A4E56_02840 [Pelotomaculum sp. PtaU1.Bin065]